MAHRRTLHLGDASYPERLCALEKPPISLTVEGGALDAPCAVAIIGARAPSPEAEQFAFDLAGSVAGAGAVVVSGGAVGVDAAAHRGALAAGGRTWAVAATGPDRCFPKHHRDLYSEIAGGPGAMIWPFAEGIGPLSGNFLRRNAVLVALAETVVIVQAGCPSGSLGAFSWAQKLGRGAWAVCGPPWDQRFAGSRLAIDGGARVLTSAGQLLQALGLAVAQKGGKSGPHPLLLPGLSSSIEGPPVRAAAPPPVEPEARALWQACSAEPRHVDEIVVRSNICASRAMMGLLTLALENVLVEGPEGFYRRAN